MTEQQGLFETPEITVLSIEESIWRKGHHIVCGLDEVGRGPGAGPTMAAAVCFPQDVEIIEGLTDSKKLTDRRREALVPIIKEKALAWGVGVVSAAEIDETNILRAALKAMAVAVSYLPHAPEYALVDGNHQAPLEIPQMTVVKGDSRSMSIAAASVIAKVVRDRYMIGLAQRYPGYGFEKHKGYLTKDHLAAIAKLGPCPEHRKTFKGVREHC